MSSGSYVYFMLRDPADMERVVVVRRDALRAQAVATFRYGTGDPPHESVVRGALYDEKPDPFILGHQLETFISVGMLLDEGADMGPATPEQLIVMLLAQMGPDAAPLTEQELQKVREMAEAASEHEFRIAAGNEPDQRTQN